MCYCLWVSGTSLRFFLSIWLWREEQWEEMDASKYHVLFVFFVSILFSLSISSLFWYHLWLLLHNRLGVKEL